MYAPFFSEMSPLNHSCLLLSLTRTYALSLCVRERWWLGRGGWRDQTRHRSVGLCALGERQPKKKKNTSSVACVRINDIGVKASRTGRLRPARNSASRWRVCTRSSRETQHHHTVESRNVKGKSGDSSPRRGATFSPSNVRTQRGGERKTSVRQQTEEFTHCSQQPHTLPPLLPLLFLLSSSSLRAPKSICPSLRWTFPAACSRINTNVAG